jgi:pilus assembly protein CpaB
LSLAVVLAVGATYLIYKTVRRGGGRPAAVRVAAAAHDLPAGTALTDKDLQMIDWPASVPLAGSFTKYDGIVARPLIYPLGIGEPVLDRDLAPEGSGLGLSAKIPLGMRATSVKSNEIVGVAGFLNPGSHVDVLTTFTVPGNPSPVTQTILQDVEVLAAGEKLEPDPQGKPQSVNVVTLLLNSQDSQILLLASTEGTVQFVLRNGADKLKTETTPTVLSQLVTAQPVALPLQVPSTVSVVKRQVSARAPLAPQPFEIEVIRGSTRSVEKF